MMVLQRDAADRASRAVARLFALMAMMLAGRVSGQSR
jgi:hypothetical protein